MPFLNPTSTLWYAERQSWKRRHKLNLIELNIYTTKFNFEIVQNIQNNVSKKKQNFCFNKAGKLKLKQISVVSLNTALKAMPNVMIKLRFDLMIIVFERKYSIDFQFVCLIGALRLGIAGRRDNWNVIKINFYDDFDFSPRDPNKKAFYWHRYT